MAQRIVGTNGPLTQWEESPEEIARRQSAALLMQDKQAHAALAAQERMAQNEQIAAAFRQTQETIARLTGDRQGRAFTGGQNDLDRAAQERARLTQSLQFEAARNDRQNEFGQTYGQNERHHRQDIMAGIHQQAMQDASRGLGGGGGGGGAGGGGGGGRGYRPTAAETNVDAAQEAQTVNEVAAFMNQNSVLTGKFSDEDMAVKLAQLAQNNPPAARRVQALLRDPSMRQRIRNSNRPLGWSLGAFSPSDGSAARFTQQANDSEAMDGLRRLLAVEVPADPQEPSAVSATMPDVGGIEAAIFGADADQPNVPIGAGSNGPKPKDTSPENMLLQAVLKERGFLRRQLPESSEAEIARLLRENVSQDRFNRGVHPGGPNDPFLAPRAPQPQASPLQAPQEAPPSAAPFRAMPNAAGAAARLGPREYPPEPYRGGPEIPVPDNYQLSPQAQEYQTQRQRKIHGTPVPDNYQVSDSAQRQLVGDRTHQDYMDRAAVRVLQEGLADRDARLAWGKGPYADMPNVQDDSIRSFLESQTPENRAMLLDLIKGRWNLNWPNTDPRLQALLQQIESMSRPMDFLPDGVRDAPTSYPLVTRTGRKDGAPGWRKPGFSSPQGY